MTAADEIDVGDVGAGHTLGRYELLLPIATGGMAVVWAARMRGTRGFQKIVAVKTMLPSLSEDTQFEEMFLAEAQLAARIKYPHVCEILDLGEQDGTLYLVMEWINGEPLATLIKLARKQVGFPFAVAARIAHSAALGLHAAHELKNDEGQPLGLVHRDVSPQNILVSYDGVVKIVDFGVAKATAAAEHGKTAAGQIKGKVPFMAPEQAIGGDVDRRTDVFALGIVLWQLCTGKHPFRGASDMLTLTRICDRAPVPRVSTLIKNVPPALDDLIARALEKQPALRFQSMLELAQALDRVLAELDRTGRHADTAAFIKTLVGDRAEKRKVAIREAIELADARALRRGSSDTGVRPSFEPMEPMPPSGVSGISEPSALSQDGRLRSVTGVTASSDGPESAPSFDGISGRGRGRGRATLVFVGLAAAAVAFAALTTTGATDFALPLASEAPAAPPAAATPAAPAARPEAAPTPVSPPAATTPQAPLPAAPSATSDSAAPVVTAAAPAKPSPRAAAVPPSKPRPSTTPATSPPQQTAAALKVKDPGF